MAIRTVKKDLNIPEENYVYFHHTHTKIIIPVDPQAVSDTMGASFASSSPLSRSAPIYSYQNSGPRTVGVNFFVHRDLCNEYNNLGYDAVDVWIQNLDQMVLPDYNSAGRIVNPPLVSLKLRDDIFIKGIVTGTSHTFDVPIINYGGKNRYAVVTLNFSVQEVTPYSASILPSIGQYRDRTGLSNSTANTSTSAVSTTNAVSNKGVHGGSSGTFGGAVHGGSSGTFGGAVHGGSSGFYSGSSTHVSDGGGVHGGSAGTF